MPCLCLCNCSKGGVWAAVGLHEIENKKPAWQNFAAEFIGTFLLVLVGCGSTTIAWYEGYKPTTVQVALAFGLIVASVVQSLGAHVNPAVTLGLLAAGHVLLLRALMYVAAQCAGAVAAAVVLKALTPKETASTLGVTALSPHVSLTQAFFVEASIAFFLVLTVCGAAAARPATGGTGFAIGLSVTACHLFAMQYTGAGMNPARSLGPAMVSGLWHNHWVYWIGPIVGGITAGVISRYVFRQSVPKILSISRDSERRPLLS